MEEKDYTSRVFYQQTSGEQLPNGMWKVSVITEERVLPTGSTEWKKEEISAEVVDKTFNLAHKIALTAVLTELQSIVYDRGFESLIEGREYQRSLEAENGADKDNSPTITQ